MKILIISGFLGAGKTTFIKELARRTKKEIAILENEYSDIGIDGDILKEDMKDEKINVWEMTEGCICCSTKKDFASSVLTIANAIDPEYLVVEPTGVAKLSNIIENISQLEYERISILSPITIVDAYSIDKLSVEFSDIYKNQLKNARTILVSKTENMSVEEKDALGSKILNINQDADVFTEHYSGFDISWWNDLLSTGYDGKKILDDEKGEDDALDNFSIRGATLDDFQRIFFVLESLIRGEYGDIIRAKGSLKVDGVNVKFDVVDSKYSILIGAESSSQNLVFIGKNIKRQKLRKIFLLKSSHIAMKYRKKI